MPGRQVDGNDVLAVYDATCQAADRARRGDGGTLIECITYRVEGHSEADQASYRGRDEVEAWLGKDPIRRLRTAMLEGGFAEAELAEPPADIVEEIRDAIEFGVRSPYPEGAEAVEDLYDEAAGMTWGAAARPNTVRIPWLGR